MDMGTECSGLWCLIQETILKRAADLAEVLYSMPRSAVGSHQLALTSRSPVAPVGGGSMSAASPSSAGGGGAVPGFSSYVGHLDAAAAGNGHWDDSAAGGWSHRYPAFTF